MSIATAQSTKIGWAESKLGFEATIKARLGWRGLKAEEYAEKGFVFLATPNIKPRDIDFENVNFITKQRYDESPEIKLKEGDVLLVKDGSTLGIVNVVRRLPRPATVNGSIAVVRPGESLHSIYLYYYLESYPFQYLVHLMKDGMGVPHLFQRDLRWFSLLVPPLPTQKAIANFLDRKTAAIDALIEKKQKLLALLKEKRTALINQAVTKGLDPNVPMKDSGIPWIGEIPAHWSLMRLKRLAQVRGGITKGQAFGSAETVQLPYLRVANVQDGYLDLSEVHLIEVRPSTVERYRLRPGDILMNEGGDNDKLGRGAVWRNELALCLHQNHVFVVRPGDPSDSNWINFTTQSAYLKHFFYRRSKQSTNLASISSSNVKEAPILFPPSLERKLILARTQENLERLNSIEQKTAKSVSKLQEYRQALITAAVTGQIDIPPEMVTEA